MRYTCLKLDEFDIELTQTGFDRFEVRYFKQIKGGLNYSQAASEFGGCVMHALACDGRLENRTAAEARKTGDRTPYFEARSEEASR